MIRILNMMSRRTILLLTLLSIFLSGNHPYGSTAVVDADTIFDVGVILNLDSTHGLVTNASIAMSHRDFYASPSSRTAHARPNIVLHVRNSRSSPFAAASAALDLISSVKVKALIASNTNQEADLAAQIANEAEVPLIALSPVLAMSYMNPQVSYLLDMDLRDTSQAKAISSLVKAQPAWNNATFLLIYDDGTSSFIPSLIATLEDDGILPFTRLVDIISQGVSRTLKQLAATKGPGVFVIHVSFSLAATFFKQAHTMGLMSEGHAWIVTARVGNLLSYVEPSAIEEGMQGVLVMRSQLPAANTTEAGKKLVHERLIETGDCHVCGGSGVDIYSLWAYDAMRLLAEAVERTYNHTSNGSIGRGQQLMDSILSACRNIISRSGLNHHHQRVAMADAFEVVKIVGKSWRRVGYWTPDCTSLSLQNWRPKNAGGVKRRPMVGKKLGRVVRRRALEDGHGAPAITNVVNILVPKKTSFFEFVHWDNKTSRPAGFCMELFNKATKDFAWKPNYTMYSEGDEFDWYYDHLVDQVAQRKYDILVGDVTITANRSRRVDFSQPYIRADIAMVVQAVDERDATGPFWFLKPLSRELWLATIALLFLRGVLLWTFEGQRNPPFRAVTKVDHLKKIISLSFTVSAFYETERLRSPYSKLITTLSMVILFMLAAGYNSTLTSMLTVDILRPKVTDLDALIANNKTIGYQKGAFMEHILLRRGAHPRQLRGYSTAEEYATALRNGPDKNGCVAIVDELPFIRVFLKNYTGFTIAPGSSDRTGGFGYVFAKGSKWLSPVTEAVLNVTQSRQAMCDLERSVFANDSTCAPASEISPVSYTKLTLTSFMYPYLFVVSISAVAFLLQLFFPVAVHARNYYSTPGRVYICEHESDYETARKAAILDALRRSSPTWALTRASSF